MTSDTIPVSGCPHLRQFLTLQTEVISEHLDRHAWFQHIEDKNQAAADFITKFGWLVRHVYCLTCNKHVECRCWKRLCK